MVEQFDKLKTVADQERARDAAGLSPRGVAAAIAVVGLLAVGVPTAMYQGMQTETGRKLVVETAKPFMNLAGTAIMTWEVLKAKKAEQPSALDMILAGAGITKPHGIAKAPAAASTLQHKPAGR